MGYSIFMNILNLIHQIVEPVAGKIGDLKKKVDGECQDPDFYRALLATDAFLAAIALRVIHKTGLMLVLHEVVGHVYCGYHITTNYTNGVRPTFSIKPFTSKAHSTGSILAYLSAPDFVGSAHPGRGKPNWLGKRLGADGTLAWHAFAGSVPQLFLDAAITIGGIRLYKKHPFLGFFLASYGLISHLVNAAYPISAGLMSPQKLLSEAKRGHDFATVAVQMGKVTGASPQKIARIMAVVFFLSVPIICLLYARSLKKQEPVTPPPT